MREKFIKFCIVTTVFCAPVFGAWADITVSGKIQEPNENGGNIPASGVLVSQKDNQGNGTTTDSNGMFTLTVPNANTMLHLSGASYSAIDIPASAFTSGSTVTISKNVPELPGTTVTGSSTNGCESDFNNRITAELALCNVHAYNIGEIKNPTGADKQLMKEVIALKTTVIAQQMNKQYEYMDAMLRRFQTQLQKAVLTTKLQKAGAAPDDANGNNSGYSSSSGYNAGNNQRITNIYLDGAENCASKLDTLEMINCLANNYTVISEATNSGQTMSADARKQLAADFKILTSANLVDKDKMLQPRSSKEYNNKCENERTISQRSGLQECLTAHSANIRTVKDEYNRKNRNNTPGNNNNN